ncbi:MAG: DsbA family protein [Pseudomonadota bacterium]
MDQFKAATQEAIALGVFGSPTYVLNGEELFFGQDRLEMLYLKLAK